MMKKFFNINYLIFLFLMGIFVAGNNLLAIESNKESQNFDIFGQLSETQKKEVIVMAFERRMQKALNIYYKLDLTVGTSKNIQGIPDDKINFFSKRNYERWQLGKSYKVKMEMFKGMDPQPLEWVTDAYDAKKGENHGLFYSNSIKDKNFGIIDTQQDGITSNDIFLYWLQDSFFPDCYMEKESFLFVYLLKHKKDWEFFSLDQENQIGLKVKCLPDDLYAFHSGNGFYKLNLDFTKDFLPVLSEMRWDALDENNNRHWRYEKYEVEKSLKINDIWMPTQLTMTLQTTAAPELFSISKVNIHEIRYDQVTPQDVVLIFPEDTAVVDAINGISYKTDANGEPIESTIEPLYGLDPSHVKLPEPPKQKINIVFLVIGILMIVTALYILIKTHRK
ncbi:MAG: hypothetical protein LBG80_12630, partial [Bacteroidales bacterium]|nr:hypothetical protein [Bacteroidales bacterium]